MSEGLSSLPESVLVVAEQLKLRVLVLGPSVWVELQQGQQLCEALQALQRAGVSGLRSGGEPDNQAALSDPGPGAAHRGLHGSRRRLELGFILLTVSA